MFIIKEGSSGGEGTDAAVRQSITEWLEKEGLTVRTADQDKTFLAANQQKAIDEAFQKRNQQLEDTVKEITGVDKASPTEKYYDYFKRAMESKKVELATLQSRVTEYETKGASGNAVAEEYKKQVLQLQTRLKEAQDEYDKNLSSTKQEIFKTKFQSHLDTTVGKLKEKFRGDIAPEFIADIVRAKTYEFESQFTPKEVEGVIVFHDKSGQPVMNKKDGKPKNSEDILTELFGSYIDPKKAQGGAGSGGSGGAGGAGGNGGGAAAPKWKEAKVPETVKTKVQLTQWLNNDLKLTSDSKEFGEAFTTLSKTPEGKELPLR